MASTLNPDECEVLADALGDTPETVNPVHLLRRGLCDAWLAGNPSTFEAAIVQSASLREEPWVFGLDVESLWRLLRDVAGWKHINVARSLARPLGAVMERETGASVRRYADVYHTLARPAAMFHDPAVRRLTPEDLPALKAAPAVVQGDLSTMLKEGIAAGAIVERRLVAIAHTSAMTDRYADIGVSNPRALAASRIRDRRRLHRGRANPGVWPHAGVERGRRQPRVYPRGPEAGVRGGVAPSVRQPGAGYVIRSALAARWSWIKDGRSVRARLAHRLAVDLDLNGSGVAAAGLDYLEAQPLGG